MVNILLFFRRDRIVAVGLLPLDFVVELAGGPADFECRQTAVVTVGLIVASV